MKISQALKQAQDKLKNAQIDSAYIDSLLLLAFVCGVSKDKIIFNPDLELSEKNIEDFASAIGRRASREPVSHIITKKEFYGAEFFVNSAVLDPRPDSETLIEAVLNKFSDKNKAIKILEIGVGSGCLIITLLKNMPNSSALGVDISFEALEVCRKNAISHQLENRLELINSDLFKKIPAQKFDLIISNPPYIPTAEIKNLQDEVRIFEPLLALDGGEDGLDYYRRIAISAKDFLNSSGILVLEIGKDQHNQVSEIFKDFKFIEQKQDLAGVVRVMMFAV